MSDGENQDTDVIDAPGSALEPAGAGHQELSTFEPAAMPMLPGEVRPHPSPFQYVLVAVVLVVLTALEIGLYYLEGDIAKKLIIALLLVLMVVKFVLVASWYMHLRTDRKIFRRFFMMGAIGAITVFSIALLTLHVYD